VLGAFLIVSRPPQRAPAAFPGQNGLIVYESTRGSSGTHLFTMRPDGSLPRQLTHGSSVNGDAAYSADGKRIVFESDRSGHAQIYEVHADGSAVRRLTHTKPGHDNNDPKFSPNRRLIVFDRFTGLFTTDVFVMRADGSHLRRLTHTRSGLSPVFSPNGKRIAFESDDARASQIYLMNPDGSHVRQLTHTADDNTDADSSPNGRRLVFRSGRTGHAEIFIMHKDGSRVQQLTHTPNGVFNYAPAFSPNGRLIVFERYASASDTDQIFTMRTDGSQLRQLTFTGAGVTNCCPDWQPLPSGG